MSKVTITLTDIQDDQGTDRILTQVQFDHRLPAKGQRSKAEVFGLALADLVQQQSSRQENLNTEGKGLGVPRMRTPRTATRTD